MATGTAARRRGGRKTTSSAKATTSADAPKRVSAKDAISRVLKKAGEPLKTKDIVERVLATKGVALNGATPAATIAAILSTENKKPDGLVERTEPGTYKLRAKTA
jgi:hypothetical protein